MKKILIMAYTHLNLGDDLFVKILCERYPQHKFYIVCPSANIRPFLNIKNLKVIKFSKFLSRIDGLLTRTGKNIRVFDIITQNIIKNCDATIHIGGSIFIENNNWKTKAYNYYKHILENKKFYVLGSNFGPYTDDEYHLTYNDIFSNIDEICFRDRYSYELFPNLNNKRVAPDVVFTAEIPECIKRKRQVVISVIDLKNREKLSKYINLYESKIASICEELINSDYNVKLMGFCESEGDNETINRILGRILPKYSEKIESYIYKGDLEEATQIINESSGIIATRFHAMILGFISKIPVLPLLYSEKMENVIKDIHFSGPYYWINEINKLEPEYVVDYIKSKKIHDVTGISNEALNQFKSLDIFLE